MQCLGHGDEVHRVVRLTGLLRKPLAVGYVVPLCGRLQLLQATIDSNHLVKIMQD